MLEYISIGQITSTYGINGELKVYPLTDNISRFDELRYVFIEKNNKLLKYKVKHIKYQKNMVIVKLEGIDNLESAISFKSSYIKVHRKDAVKLPENSFFVCDLINAEVFTTDGLYLGKVDDIIETGSNDVFIVKKQNFEVLIPGLKSIFKEVNIIENKIIVDLPEGLI